MKTEKKEKPEWVSSLVPGSELTVDMRRFLRYGVEPLPAIEDLLKELRPCQVLRLAAKEEPVQLYEILGPMGFEHYAEPQGHHWDVYFRKCGC